MLRVIKMCLRPKVDNRNNTTRSLESLGCASGTNFTSGIIPYLFQFMTLNSSSYIKLVGKSLRMLSL